MKQFNSKLKNIARRLYKKFFPGWLQYLKKELSNCDSVLDLGCGCNSLIEYCNVPFSVGVDLFEPYLKESKKRGIHSQYIKADIREIEFKTKSFNAVVCIMVLEHLTKKEGYKLISKMERWAKKKIIIVVPNRYVPQDSIDNNPLQKHKSGWSVSELKKLGFKVFGINGWKRLRGPTALIRYKPTLFWERISALTQKVTYHYPKLACHLVAIKEINKK